jgi:glutaconate CoA-transferase subunit A
MGELYLMLNERIDKRIKLEEMSDLVKDGMTVGIGGYLTASKPMAIIRQIIKKGVKDLTVIAFPSSIELDLLVACGCVKKVICPYVGMESLSPIAPFQMKAKRESLN